MKEKSRHALVSIFCVVHTYLVGSCAACVWPFWEGGSYCSRLKFAYRAAISTRIQFGVDRDDCALGRQVVEQ